MGKPYSDDLRERVVAAIEAGHTRVKVAELYNMALSTVGGFIKRKRETGSISPDKFGGYKTFALEPHAALVKELVAEQPDSTLAELQVRLAKEKVKVSQSGISRFLHHINLTFKKKAYTRQNKIGPTLPRPVRPCGKNSLPLIRSNLSSSMRPPPRPK
jgi:transposase